MGQPRMAMLRILDGTAGRNGIGVAEWLVLKQSTPHNFAFIDAPDSWVPTRPKGPLACLPSVHCRDTPG